MQSDQIESFQIRFRESTAIVVDLDHVHVALERIVGRHRKDLHLKVMDVRREDKAIVVDLFE